MGSRRSYTPREARFNRTPILRVWLMAVVVVLSGCAGGSGSGGSEDGTATRAPSREPALPPPDRGAAGGLYFVSEFDPAAVSTARSRPRFLAHDLRIDYSYAGNPRLDGVVRDQNAFAVAGVHFAHSVGLAGRGQTIAINDSRPRLSHAEFRGKRVSVSGSGGEAAFHGTATASVAAGSDVHGSMLGVAPKANLHVGRMDFRTATSLTDIGGFFGDARGRGAVVSSNSWNFEGATAADTDYRLFEAGDGARFVRSLRRFAQDGVIVFAVQNDVDARSVNLMNGLPLAEAGLEGSWIAATSVLPRSRRGRITGGSRLAARCNEAARYCLAANGTVRVATARGRSSYSVGGGTSFAAPQIAGAVALLAEAFPTLSARQIRDRLLITADNSWFRHDGTMRFEGGVRHGYSKRFGHGFLDLRAALLPVGGLTVPMANGRDRVFGRPMLVAGGASGDALIRGLAERRIVVRDGLGAPFRAPALGLLGRVETADSHADPAAFLSRDLDAEIASRFSAVSAGQATDGQGLAVRARRHPFLFRADGLVEASGAGEIDLTPPDSTISATALLSPHGNDGGASALRIARPWRRHGLTIETGLTLSRESGNFLGIEMDGRGNDLRTDAVAAALRASMPLGASTRVDMMAETGWASGPGSGALRGFENVRFSRMAVGVLHRGVFGTEDYLGLHLRRPLAIESGHARLRLPTGVSPGGAARQETVRAGLAPLHRQADLALEYAAVIGDRMSLALGAMGAWNHGHVRGERDAAVVAILQRRF